MNDISTSRRSGSRRATGVLCMLFAAANLLGCDFLDRLRGDRDAAGAGTGAAADGLVLHETFDHPSGQWPTGPNAAIAAGAYKFAPGSEPVIRDYDRSIRDGSARVRLRFTGGDENRPAGLAVRHDDDGDFVCFAVDARGQFSLGQIVDGTYLAISKPERAETFVPGADNTLELIWNGTRVYGMINGARVVTAFLETIRPGTVGLYVAQNVGVDVDDLTIWDIGLRAPGVFGTVTSGGAPVPSAPVSLVLVTDLAALEGRVLDETVTDGQGNYAFRPPADGVYLVEAGNAVAPGGAGPVLTGMRLIDFRLEPGGGRRDVELVQPAAKGGVR